MWMSYRHLIYCGHNYTKGFLGENWLSVEFSSLLICMEWTKGLGNASFHTHSVTKAPLLVSETTKWLPTVQFYRMFLLGQGYVSVLHSLKNLFQVFQEEKKKKKAIAFWQSCFRVLEKGLSLVVTVENQNSYTNLDLGEGERSISYQGIHLVT